MAFPDIRVQAFPSYENAFFVENVEHEFSRALSWFKRLDPERSVFAGDQGLERRMEFQESDGFSHRLGQRLQYPGFRFIGNANGRVVFPDPALKRSVGSENPNVISAVLVSDEDSVVRRAPT